MTKMQDLKNQAFQLAQKLGLHCTQTAHFKKRCLTVGLDLRFKNCWAILIQRLKELAFGVVVPFLQQQPIAA
jgi:hypothetical protein